MSWATPKNNWAVEVVGSADFNRIEDNIITLHKGNGHTLLQTLTVETNFNIGLTDQSFIVVGDGVTSITYIYVGTVTSTQRQPGNIIHVINTSETNSVPIVQDGGSAPSGYANIKSAWALESIHPKQVATFIYSGSSWFWLNNPLTS